MKKIFFLILLINVFTFPADKARGVFLAFGVGPRLPVSFFASSTDLGYGFNLEISYTDNEYLPFFIFLKGGYEQYPGSQDFYRRTTYSNYSTVSVPLNAGIRYYFPPLVENIVLLIPIAEVSASYSYFQKLHEFKAGTQRSNFTEESSKIGISGGLGISMFMLEVLATYNYFETNQYVAFDLKVRLPLYIVF
jgi:hypothetical protein